MKTPLRVEPLETDPFFDHMLVDADGEFLACIAKRESIEALVALANSHAAQPGPPREDGVWDVLLNSGKEYVCVRETFGTYISYRIGVFEVAEYGVDAEAILMHRKHTPLEVPK